MPGGASATQTESRNSKPGAKRSKRRRNSSSRLAADRKLPEEVVAPIRAYHRERLKRVTHRSDGDGAHSKLVRIRDDIDCQLIAAERKLINDLYRSGKLKDEARRRIERELDLREAHLASIRAEDDYGAP